jgi:hypothetical protein
LELFRKATEARVMSESKQHSWPRRALAEHPALLVSGIYFAASLIGLVYSWALLRAFGINVFRYAEISDFLLASLKEPFTWFLAILAIILIIFDNAMSLRMQRRGPSRFFRWYGSERYRQINYLASVLLVVVFLLSYATVKERGIRDGEGEIVSVYLTDGSPPKQVVMLGTTARFVFLYDEVAERVDIHPNESILVITKLSPDSRKD